MNPQPWVKTTMKNRALALFLLALAWSAPAFAAHGLSLDGGLKYPAGFPGFDYTSPQARVGGTLTLHEMGAFDKMNPFTLKGEAPGLLTPLVFETLAVHSQDEPFAQYGLLAKDMEVAKDGLSITYTLNPDARFSDKTPVQAEDVLFSFNTLKSEQAHPSYASYWRDATRAEVVAPDKVRIHFARQNRELPLIMGDLPVLSRTYFASRPFEKGELSTPLGSGPYVVESFDAGKSLTFRRNPDYWGWKQPVRRGMFNFERIVVKYFKDDTVTREAFKAGEFDFIHENNSKNWARDYEGEKFTSKTILKEPLPHKNGAGMQGFVFNLRKPVFQDIRVREAISLAFDFEWSNKNLFYDQYTRSVSFFSNSELAAEGPPSPAELKLLEPLRDKLSKAVFEAPILPPSTTPPASLRENMRRAKGLLEQAGWKLGSDGVMSNAKGERLQFEMPLVNPAFERILAPFAANLKKLGMVLEYRTVDSSLLQRRTDSFDYDMLVGVFPQSQSPGNEQRNMWHSSSAEVKGSRNLIGLKDPAVDALVEAIIYAADREALKAACRALDRVLRAGHYVVPNYHIPFHRVAYWNRFQRPEKMPLYYSPEDWLFSWWERGK